MGRPLTGMERGLFKTDLAAPLNFTTVARVSGPLDDDALRAALPALRARHPHLRERIEHGELVDDDVPPLTLRIGSADWVAELEHEINTPVGAPLARFVRCADRLLVTLHHVVGDGWSGVYLMRDWLRAVAGESLEPLEDPGGVDSLIRGAPGMSNHARFLGRELVMTRHGWPVKVRRDAQAFAYERRARVKHVVLDAEPIAARARAEKTTVHGALSAAMLLAILNDSGRSKASVNFGSPVNVRSSAGVGEELGFYVSMLSLRAVLSADAPFWDVARVVRRSLEADLQRKLQLSLISLMPTLWNVIGADEVEPKTLARAFEVAVPTTSGLTNLGRLDVQTRFGALQLEECHFAPNPSALGDFVGTATSLNGRLFWNLVWTDPVMSAPHADALVADMVNRLEVATRSP